MVEIFDERFLSFVLVFAALIVTPGPDTAVVIRSALAGGRRAAWLTALGVAVGTVLWIGGTLIGVAALMRASPPAFALLQLAGGAYLAYLGVRSIVAAVRARDGGDAVGVSGGAPGDAAAFRQGLLSNLLNAKTVPFFVSVLPQFVEPADTALRLVAMLAAYELMLLAWLGAYGYVVSRAARAFLSPGARRWLEGATGLVLIALAARLLLGPR